MSGGNMRVQNRPVGTLGMANQVETVDAHSTKAGSFSEARQVGGQNVYLTPEGAKALDALSEAGFELRATKDPGALSKMLLGDFLGNKGEQHQGSVR
jgi:hypothetical protein